MTGSVATAAITSPVTRATTSPGTAGSAGESPGAPMRLRLIAAAARLLREDGPAALSTRKVAAAASTSTMAVYSNFGSMEALVAAVVDEGFHILEGAFLALRPSDDPLADIAAQSSAYLDFATQHADLYAVMFGTAYLGQYRPSGYGELAEGRRRTLDRVADNLARAIQAGRLNEAPSSDLAFTWWSAVHGYAMLESAGRVDPAKGRGRVFLRLLTALFVGLGDDPARSATSVGHIDR